MHRTLFVAVYGEYPTKEILYRAMLPFHIHETTGIEDYTILVDMTKEMEEDLELLRKSSPKERSKRQCWIDLSTHVYKSSEYIQGKGSVYFTRTNPDGKWDYYMLGGRYVTVYDELAGKPGPVYKKSDLDYRAYVEKQKPILEQIQSELRAASSRYCRDHKMTKAELLQPKNFREFAAQVELYADPYSDRDLFLILEGKLALEDIALKRYVPDDLLVLWKWYSHNDDMTYKAWHRQFFREWDKLSDDHYIAVVDYHC